MSGTIFSILPPIIAIVMVLITKRVLLSLGTGIIAGALIVASFSPLESIKAFWTALTITFWDGGLNKARPWSRWWRTLKELGAGDGRAAVGGRSNANVALIGTALVYMVTVHVRADVHFAIELRISPAR